MVSVVASMKWVGLNKGRDEGFSWGTRGTKGQKNCSFDG